VAGLARVGAYEPPLRALGIGLKYRGRERNGDYLGELLAAELSRLGWPAELDALVPVPMSRLRRWQRPCDHAEALALGVARRLGLPVWRAVVRVRHTPSQTGVTSRAARFANVAGCFTVRRGVRLEGRRVCIVDNLLATGATIHEVAKALRRARAKEIRAAVVSRTVLAGDVQADSEAIEEAFPAA
jgi:ComF family protein